MSCVLSLCAKGWFFFIVAAEVAVGGAPGGAPHTPSPAHFFLSGWLELGCGYAYFFSETNAVRSFFLAVVMFTNTHTMKVMLYLGDHARPLAVLRSDMALTISF